MGKSAGNQSPENKIVVTLPLPPSALNPNAKGQRTNWPRIRAKKKYREDAYVAAIADGARDAGITTANVQCRFYFRTKRRRDGDNYLAAMKAGFDGLTDAGVFVDDSGLRHQPVEMEIDKTNPRVEIHITPLEEN